MRSGAALLILAASLLLVGPSAARSLDLVAPTVSVSCSPGGGCGGWFTGNVNLSFSWGVPPGETFWSETGCNGTSITSDTSGQPYSCEVTVTPDGGMTKVSGSVSGSIRRDATPPTVTSFSANRGPDSNGWYDHALTISASGTDATSGIASCTTTTYSGPDSSSASVSGTCTDAAGNVSSSKSFAFPYDASPPSVTAQPARGPDANGWYNHPVSFGFAGTDTLSGIDSCTSSSYGGPDGTNISVAGSCKDKAGNNASASTSINYDATPPTVTGATPSRPPDSNGWYNHPFDLTFQGSDGGSGIDSCTTTTYKGPDRTSGSTSGSCRDKAGNTSASASFDFKYDATPPTLADIVASTGDKTVVLTWKASKDTARIEITRELVKPTNEPHSVLVYHGPATRYTDASVANGKKYLYSLTAYDEAGNKVVRTITVIPQAPLFAPLRGAAVASPPTLAWKKDPRATYYNVQLFRGGTKVLTAWPTHPWLALKRTWSYQNRVISLVPGRYIWYVFPGYGAQALQRYGKMLGVSTFAVTR